MKRVTKGAAVTAAAAVGIVGFGVNPASAESGSYTVQPGDTLYGLVGSNYAAVAAANGIENPDLIYPGQVINLDATGSAPAPAPAPEEAPEAAPASSSSEVGNTVWDRLAQCESSGDWHINTGNGYYGGLQFLPSSWRAAGGSGMPHEASRAEQIRVAENLLEMQGWGAWPSCSAQLGLR